MTQRTGFLAAAIAALCVVAPLARAQSAPPDDTAHLVAIASRWTMRFEQALSGLLFRERYLQRVDGVPARSGRLRLSTVRHDTMLEANVFLLKPDGVDTFVLFRDVYSRDGENVADHTARLAALLADGSRDAIARARSLTDASARFNVGPVARNVNIPTMGMAYLEPGRVGGVRFTRAGDERIDGVDTVILAFEETARPTFVRGDGNSDVSARGRYWVHPGSGAIIRAQVAFAGDELTGSMQVETGLHETLSVWVPRRMNETWRAMGQRTTGFAEYDRFQRLTISTGEIVR